MEKQKRSREHCCAAPFLVIWIALNLIVVVVRPDSSGGDGFVNNFLREITGNRIVVRKFHKMLLYNMLLYLSNIGIFDNSDNPSKKSLDINAGGLRLRLFLNSRKVRK